MRLRIGTLTLAIVMASLASPMWASAMPDQLLLGKKLLIKNPRYPNHPNKVIHLVKDDTIAIDVTGTDGDPTCDGLADGGGSLRLKASGGAGDATITLPCANWSTNSSNTIYKYKNLKGNTCETVVVKPGAYIKAICIGAQVAIDLNGSMAPVDVVMTLNSSRYCTRFGGTIVKEDGSNERRFLHKDAPSPGVCASPSGAFVDGTSPF
jgi:hypothetical protein